MKTVVFQLFQYRLADGPKPDKKRVDAVFDKNIMGPNDFDHYGFSKNDVSITQSNPKLQTLHVCILNTVLTLLLIFLEFCLMQLFLCIIVSVSILIGSLFHSSAWSL